MTSLHQAIEQCIDTIDGIILGKRQQIKLALSCLLADGHLLLEDMPGMGKTTLSASLAHTLGLAFNRIQFTADLLPADVLGVNIYSQQKEQFDFHRGPIFANVVLADEINRASPKTQSALLEAMEEKQVTVDGQCYPLAQPFFVIATQNPLHQAGTYPLPESQLDRFLMCLELGYPDADAEKAMLRAVQDTGSTISAQLTPPQLQQAMNAVHHIKVSEAILDYVIRLVQSSRQRLDKQRPLSPRASKGIIQCAKSWAFLQHRDYVLPEDVQAVFPAVAEHRMRPTLPGQTDYSLSQALLDDVDPLAP